MIMSSTQGNTLRVSITRILGLALAAAVAQQALPAEPGHCVSSADGITVTCTGEWKTSLASGTQFFSPPASILNVQQISGPIELTSGYAVRFVNGRGGNVIVNNGTASDPVVIRMGLGASHAIFGQSVGTPPNPPESARDQFLGVFLVRDPDEPIDPNQPVDPNRQDVPDVPGGLVEVNNFGDIQTLGDRAHGIYVTSSSGGYGTAVTGPLASFDSAKYQFVVSAVRQPGEDGAAGALGQAIAGVLIDANGQVLRDDQGNALTAGEFVLRADGSYDFNPGAYFDSLDLAEGETVHVAVDYTVLGTNASGGTQEEMARLVVNVRGTADGGLEEVRESHFATYGASDGPTEDPANPDWVPTVLPDLQGFIDRQLAIAQLGSAGGGVSVTDQGRIETRGLAAYGIYAETKGSTGAAGRNGSMFRSAHAGQRGKDGGPVSVNADGSIWTYGEESAGVVAMSRGGDGGHGGEGGTWRYGKPGGDGADGGHIELHGDGEIHTEGAFASGIIALSVGGDGADGGSGAFVTGGGPGGYGGQGGDVEVAGHWDITTIGDKAHGIWAKSAGGNAGTGGSGGWLGGSPGAGGRATDGGSVTVTSGGAIHTSGNDAFGIQAQSIGGFGGKGGGGFSLFYSAGGNGASAGSGGSVTVTQTQSGEIVTGGDGSHGILAQSIGGGGGSGGGTSGFIAVGGASGAGGNGGEVDVTNAGRIATDGLMAYGILAQSIGGGGGDGGTAKGAGGIGGAGRAGGEGRAVTVVNAATGNITASGAQSMGIMAQSIGGGGGNGGSTGGIVAIGGEGSETSDGGTVTVDNDGSITATSYGIFAQSIGGGGGNGGSSTGWFSFGGKGGGGGDGAAVTVDNGGNVATSEADASGVFAQSVGGGGGNGGASIAVGLSGSLAIGGEGAKGGRGDLVTVDSGPGTITTIGDRSRGIFAQSVGGGGGSGGYAFAGSIGPGVSLSVALGGKGAAGGAGGDVVLDSEADIGTQGADAHGIFAQSVGGGGGAGGFSVAASLSDGFAAAFSMGGKGGAGGEAGFVTLGAEAAPLRGLISTEGYHAYGILAQSVGGGGGDGGFSIAASVSGGVGATFGFGGNAGVGGAGRDVKVWSANDIQTLGNDSHGLFAQSVGGGGGSGGFSVAGGLSGSAALSASFGGAGGAGASAGDVTLASSGDLISTRGTHAYGAIAQSIGGSGGDGGFSVAAGVSASANLSFSMGGSGGKGGTAGDVGLTSSTSVQTLGDDSHGLFAQSVGGGGGSGGFSVTGGVSVGSAQLGASIGGSGGEGGNAGLVTLVSDGDAITTAGHRAYGMVAQSIGGSGGNGGFSVAGGISQSASVNFAMGGTGGKAALAGDVTLASSSSVQTLGQDAHGIFAQSVGGSGGSGGFAVAGGISANSAQVSAGIGGKGGEGGNAGAVTVTSSGDVVGTVGDRSYGILAQSVGGSGGDGGFSVAGGLSRSASVNFAMGGAGGKGSIGGAVTLSSLGNIYTQGRDAHGLFAQSVGGSGGSGGFAVTGGLSSGSAQIGASIGGKGGEGSAAGDVRLDSGGEFISTLGDRSYGILAQSIGGSGGDGGFSIAGGLARSPSINFAMGGGGGKGSTGGTVTVNSTSSLVTAGDDAHAVFAQSVGGGGGSGGFAVAGGYSKQSAQVAVGIGGRGGAGGDADEVTVNASGELITTAGSRAYGVLAQSVGGGGGDGGFGIAGGMGDRASVEFAMGGGGAGGGDGAHVDVTSAGGILTGGDYAHGIVAQSVGGGGGTGGFAATGSLARGPQSRQVSVSIGGSGGVGGDAGAVEARNAGAIETLGVRAYGVLAQSVGGGGGDGGMALVKNVLEEYQAPELPPDLDGDGEDDPEKDEPKSLSFGITVGAGGAGGAAGTGNTVRLENSGSVLTHGLASYGLFAQSVGGGGGAGGLSATDGTGGNGEIGIAIGVTLGGGGGGGGAADLVWVNSRGTVATLGAGAHGILAQSVGGGGGAGGASVSATAGPNSDAKVAVDVNVGVGGSGGVAGNGGAVRVENAGLIETMGDDAFGILAQSVGGGGGDGGRSIVTVGEQEEDEESQATEGDTLAAVAATAANDEKPPRETWSVGLAIGAGGAGGAAGAGDSVAVENEGTIVTHGSGSHAVFAQSVGGGGGTGGFSASGSSGGSGNVAIEFGLSLGGRGGGGGSGSVVRVQNAGELTTLGDGAHGIVAQSVGGGGGTGGSSMSSGRSDKPDEQLAVNLNVAVGGGGGVAGDGSLVLLQNTGSIETLGYGAYAVLAQSIGGGGGHGGLSAALPGGSEESVFNLAVGVGGGGGAGGIGSGVYLSSQGWLVTHGDDSIAVFAQSIGGGGGAGGSSLATSGGARWGALDVGIGGGGGSGNAGGTVSITNAGHIDTAGRAAHAVFVQSIGGGGGRGGSAQTLDVGESGSGSGLSFGLSVGGSGEGGSSGGAVQISNVGDVVTRGLGAHGMLVQSIGGGGGEGGYGGYAGDGDADESEDAYRVPDLALQVALGGSAGSGGDGGQVHVSDTGNVVTLGNGSVGILAQSIGGGGGVGAFGVAAATGSVAIGGAGGAAGDGGEVRIDVSGSVETFGRSAYGVLAQSIGGGGGAAGDVAAGIDPLEGFGIGLAFGRDAGGGGDGGTVRVATTGDIVTHGAGAIGIFAQSVGGGGGLAGTATGLLPFAGSVGGEGAGGLVSVRHAGDIITLGNGAHGIVAQSAGGTLGGAAVDVTVSGTIAAFGVDASGVVLQSRGDAGTGNLQLELQGGAIQGGSGEGAGVVFLDGLENLFVNRGTVAAYDGLDGYAVRAFGGNETLRNFGVISGSLSLGGGTNVFENASGAVFNSGPLVDLGSNGTLHNSGTLSPGGAGQIMTTVFNGDLLESSSAVHLFDVDMSNGVADAFNVSGAYTAGGVVNLSFLGPVRATTQTYSLVAAGSALESSGLSLGDYDAPAALRVDLTYDGGTALLTLEPDFSLDGLSLTGNQGALGEYFNDVLAAGAGAAMQGMLDKVVLMPTAEALGSMLEQLQPGPYAALSSAAATSQMRFNDALLSCRAMTGEHRFTSERDCAWGRVAVWDFEQEATAQVAGYEQSSFEASAGLQKAVGDGERWYAGLGLSYESIDIDADPATRSDGTLVQVGGIIKGRFGPATAALAAGWGTGSYDTQRRVTVVDDELVARSQQDLTMYTFRLRASYDFEGRSWYVRPMLDFDYASIDRDGFTERGAGAANLAVEGRDDDYSALRPAVEVGWEHGFESGTQLRPFVRLGATAVLDGESTAITAGFADAPDGVEPFVTRVDGPDSYTDVAAGIDLLRTRGLSLRLGYFGQFSSRTDLNSVGLKVWMPLQ